MIYKINERHKQYIATCFFNGEVKSPNVQFVKDTQSLHLYRIDPGVEVLESVPVLVPQSVPIAVKYEVDSFLDEGSSKTNKRPKSRNTRKIELSSRSQETTLNRPQVEVKDRYTQRGFNIERSSYTRWVFPFYLTFSRVIFLFRSF